MATNINTRDLFQKDDYTDVIVKFGDEEIKCHRLVLCMRSKYFKTLLKPDSGFIENNQTAVELKDDKSHGVKALLRYLYTLGYEVPVGEETDWRYHLDVAEVADKYGAEELESLAWATFRGTLDAVTDISVILALLLELPERDYGREFVNEIVEHLRDKHLDRLLEEQEFRTALEADMGLMWKYLDRLSFAQNLVTMEPLTCRWCGGWESVELDEKSLNGLLCCGDYREKGEMYWVKKK